MNKSRFIERLNLYLDNELSEEASDYLLQAIRENPEYHRIYVQYCQIHNACSRLGDLFVEERPRSAVWQKLYAVGGMAAAVALLGLAVQNLAPIISDDAQSAEITTIAVKPSSIPEEALLVLDGNAFAGTRLIVDSFDVKSFDVNKAFEQLTPSGMGQPSIQFVNFSPAQTLQRGGNSSKREFSFGKAVQSSTFEHELLVSREDPNAGDISEFVPIGSVNGVEIDFGKAASFSSSGSSAFRVAPAKE